MFSTLFTANKRRFFYKHTRHPPPKKKKKKYCQKTKYRDYVEMG